MASALPDKTPALLQQILQQCEETWNAPGLAGSVEIQVSPRMKRTLGRALLQKRIIRLAGFVVRGPQDALREVLVHEAAHIVAFDRFGTGIRPHGRQWAELMEQAGLPARARVDPTTIGLPTHPPTRRRTRTIYEHRCPACQARRLARRAMRRWQCAACLEAGLPGKLEILRWRSIQGGRA